MYVRCPHCHNPIELVADASLVDITCPSCGSTFSLISGETTASHASPGSRNIAHFELVRELGLGKFGSVWLARDTQLDRTVALKIPRREQLAPEETDFFFREARAAAQLRHPNIVSVHEVGREGDTAYIVSDYIDGASLRDWLSGQRLTTREAAELVFKVADALDHAHRAGVVHRDVKPGNIILDQNGEPHVADFGLAKRASGEITMTVDGHVLGTPAYMSPEQAGGKGHEADARSDVYSLGVVLFELLTGELPFRGEREMLLMQIRRDEPPRPRRLNHRIPRDLETITLKCLEKEPGRRYHTALQLADDLKRWLAGKPIVARPVGNVERSWRWVRRNPVVATLAASIIALLTATAIGSTMAAVRIAAARDAANSSAREARLNAARAAQNAQTARRNAEAAHEIARQEQVARGDAERNLAEAQRQRARAETSYRQARRAVDNYFTLVSTNPLLIAPVLEPLREELINAASEYHRQFVEENKDAPELRGEVAASYGSLGMINQVLGRDPTRFFIQSVDITNELLQEGVPLQHLGSLRDGIVFPTRNNPAIQDPVAGLVFLGKAKRAYEALVKKYPDIPGFRTDLGAIYGTTAYILWRQGKPDLAITLYKQVEDLYAPLLEIQPIDSEHLYSRAILSLQKARALQTSKNLTEAESNYRASVGYFESIPVNDPRTHDVAYSRAATVRDLAYMLWDQPDRRNESITLFREAIGTIVALTKRFPDVEMFQLEIVRYQQELALMMQELGHVEDALAIYNMALERFESYAPGHVSSELLDLVHPLFDRVVAALRSIGRSQQADETTRRKDALRSLLIRELLEKEPNKVDEKNDLAWWFATSPDPDVRNAARAIELAMLAVAAAPNEGRYWNTLGVAYYRGGQSQEALEALQKSVTLRAGGDAWDLFFVAMARLRLGDGEEARKAFDRAVDWMKRHQPPNEELLRVRAEAAEALGITDHVDVGGTAK